MRSFPSVVNLSANAFNVFSSFTSSLHCACKLSRICCMASLLASIRARSSCKPASRQSSILIRSRFSASMLATCAASKACDVSNELRIRATLSMRSSRSTAASFEEFSSCIMIVESARSRSHLSKSRDADSSSRLLASSLFSERRSLFSCSIAWRSVSNCVMVSSSAVARSFVSNSSLLVIDVRSLESSATSLALSELAPSSRACSSSTFPFMACSTLHTTAFSLRVRISASVSNASRMPPS